MYRVLTSLYYGPGEMVEGGVADNLEQILEHHTDLHDEEQIFLIQMVTIQKSEQAPKGGFRWSRTGEYIGTQNLQQEYLYDEPEVEEVIAYRIYKVGGHY